MSYELQAEDIEPVYNHVHHARSLCLMEMARLKFLESIGFANEELMKQNIFLVITSIKVEYMRELLGGTITLTCQDQMIKYKTMRMTQEILNPAGKQAVVAEMDFCCLSRELGRSIVPPPDFAAKFIENVPGSTGV
jgi:YbgC/YbaW family acyl-CoA thioester hydrolase